MSACLPLGLSGCLYQGRPSHPETMMHFPPYFRFPLFSKNSKILLEILKFYHFPKKFPIFIRQNFWWLFFSHRLQILNPPYFACFSTFPLDWRKLLFPPYFHKFPPVFGKFTSFLILSVYFPPLLWPWCMYASPNARTGRPWSLCLSGCLYLCLSVSLSRCPSLSHTHSLSSFFDVCLASCTFT